MNWEYQKLNKSASRTSQSLKCLQNFDDLKIPAPLISFSEENT